MDHFANMEKLLTKRIEEGNVKGPDLALLYNDRGHARYMQVDFDAAINDYSKAIEINSSCAVAYYNRGTVQYRLGCFEAAFQDMRKAVELDPNNYEFHDGLEACDRTGTTK